MKFNKVCSLIKSVAPAIQVGSLEIADNKATLWIAQDNHEIKLSVPVEDVPADFCKRTALDSSVFRRLKAEHYFARINDISENITPGDVEPIPVPEGKGSLLPNASIKNFIKLTDRLHDSASIRDLVNTLWIESKEDSIRFIATNGKGLAAKTIPSEGTRQGFYGLPHLAFLFVDGILSDKKTEYRLYLGENREVAICSDKVTFIYTNTKEWDCTADKLTRFIETADSQAVLSAENCETLLACTNDRLESIKRLGCYDKETIRFTYKGNKLFAEKDNANVQRTVCENLDIASKDEFDYVLFAVDYIKMFAEFFKKEGREVNLHFKGKNDGILWFNEQDYVILMPIRG